MKTFALSMLLLVGCAATPDANDDDVGPFVPSEEDETLIDGDPPTDPDPIDDDESALHTTSTSEGCRTTSKLLSPKGLTFVIHVSKHAGNAAREVEHLEALRRYIRARDVFMIEHGSPQVSKLRELFPCNRFHFIAYPAEMDAALSTGDGIDGISVDWEGSSVDANSSGWSADRLREYANKIHAHGKSAGVVPAWPAWFDDAAITKQSGLDYDVAQIQGGCVNGASNFAWAGRRLLRDFHEHGVDPRNVGLEISMDSFSYASNHVDSDRSSECTRKAYGRGARTIYLYGNGQDQLPDYFHALAKIGVRTPR